MQINETNELMILRSRKPLGTNRTVSITHQLGDLITVLKKKAALIMYAAILIVTVAGCGSESGGGIAGSDIGTNEAADTSGTADTGGVIAGSATLAWNAPATNTDGTPLTNLAGYKIYYGTSSGNYTSVINVGNVSTYTIANLAPGAYYFAVTSYDIAGIESAYSNEASKIIQ